MLSSRGVVARRLQHHGAKPVQRLLCVGRAQLALLERGGPSVAAIASHIGAAYGFGPDAATAAAAALAAAEPGLCRALLAGDEYHEGMDGATEVGSVG